MILLLDNTVLSNFALVGHIDLLPKVLGAKVATTPHVMGEFDDGVSRGRLPKTNFDWLELITLEAEEEIHLQKLLARVNVGEASCLAVASYRNGRFLTDDRDARKLAALLQIPISGTLGILQRLVKRQTLSFADANQILADMISKGYRSPVQTLDEL